ncbi:MAG: hypothetical protein R3F61_02165 [Myxococcota bacterium]
MRHVTMLPLAFCLLGLTCTDDPKPTDTDLPGDLTWFTTCGDPVCGGYGGPFPDVPACTTEAEDDPCSTDGTQCDPMSDCNALLVCASEDPKDQVGGCPISQAAAKRDIAYLDPTALRSTADEAMAMKLATWSYTWEEPGTRPHLGFIIDDAPGSAAVRTDGERVDLYGYTSLALAALQVQQAEITALRAELAELRSRLAPDTCGTAEGAKGTP